MESADLINVELVYIKPPQQVILQLHVNVGATIGQVIRQSGILERFDEIDLNWNPVGIYSEVKGTDTVVRAGDRVEIYRPLVADPKESRRRRAQLKKTKN